MWAPFVVVGEGGAQLQTASLPAPSPADASAKGDPPAKEEPAAAPARPKPKATTRKTRSRTGSPTSGAGSGYPHRAVMRAFIQVAVAATPPNEKRCTPTTLLALPERAWRASAMS